MLYCSISYFNKQSNPQGAKEFVVQAELILNIYIEVLMVLFSRSERSKGKKGKLKAGSDESIDKVLYLMYPICNATYRQKRI
jgi:hypothetical protein